VFLGKTRREFSCGVKHPLAWRLLRNGGISATKEGICGIIFYYYGWRRWQKKRSKEISIRSSAAEYLTFVAATGGSNESMEVRYENEGSL
jgi:hypothetical protein